MMTSMDLTSRLDQRVVARQMYKSVLDYMNSDHFRPTEQVDIEIIRNLFIKKRLKLTLLQKIHPMS